LVIYDTASVVDTAEQFIAGVIRDYLGEFLKKVEMILMEYSGARGTLIHEKN
jgi:transposase